jgi:hypothetical protein
MIMFQLCLCPPPLVARYPYVLSIRRACPGWTRHVRPLPSPRGSVHPDPTAASTAIKVSLGHVFVSISDLIEPTVLLGGSYNPLILRLLSNSKGRSTCVWHFPLKVPLLTSSRCNMRGKGKSHGVSYSG